MDLEELWNRLLSQEISLIKSTYLALDEASRKAVLQHLQRMTTEEGWHPLQRESAQAALDVLLPLTRV